MEDNRDVLLTISRPLTNSKAHRHILPLASGLIVVVNAGKTRIGGGVHLKNSY